MGTRFKLLASSVVAAANVAAFVPPVSAQDVKDTLRVAMYAPSSTRGHVYGTTFTSPGMYWWEAVYDSFVRIDDKGQPQPFVIESWQVVNPTTWRIKVRKGVTFNSGRVNDAENMAAVFAFLHTDLGKTAGIMRNFGLTSFKAVDAETVELVTPAPDPLLVSKFGAFYLADMKAFGEMGVENFALMSVVRSFETDRRLY